MNWGRRAVLVAAIAAGAAGCAGEPIESAIDAPLPDYVKPCADQYENGELIDYGVEGDFSKACSDGEELVTPVPVVLNCTDGPDLVYNDFAWGYQGEEMTLFEDSDTERRPSEEDRLTCLQESDSSDDEADE
jgi:hypothetical protein